MSDARADRNLLIGILALQMDFVDRDRLIAAMRAWVDEKTKSLDDILLEQGAIGEDTKVLLAGLVDKHIDLHAGDPALSLASVEVAQSVRRELADLDDDDLDRTIALASGTTPYAPRRETQPQDGQSQDSPSQDSPSQDSPSIGAAETRAMFVGEAPPGTRFRVLRLHDKGGIGNVSVAVDDELHREVALKEIQEKYAGNEAARERFTLEAEITGGLEHPGIVPVYGFGHYHDGRPFYAMRFIRGDNLHEAIRRYHDPDRPTADRGANYSGDRNSGERAVEFRRLLSHMVDVCHAIEYAHSRGVLHRDLKPSNIMLGMYGETLVVDWGLAKTSLHPEATPLTNEKPLIPVYSSGTDNTRQGTQLGTPAFMAPEQAEGNLDKVDARSDVYSLGATLYQLLTNQRAFHDGSVLTILTKVRRGDFPPPRKVKPDTPRALNAICLKAMAYNPAARYQSVAELAADIEHWLADEPVAAWKEPLAVCARRWVKRHRALVASTAAAAAAALLILSATVGLLNSAKNREMRQRQRAEENLSLAKQAVDVMLTEVASEQLENVPQMEATREKLLAKARDFYGKFRDQTPDDPALRQETALANKRLGDIFRLMGSVDESQAAYDKAIELLAALHAEFPERAEYQQQLANANNYLGVLYKKFDRAAALETYNKTVRLQSDLVERHPAIPVYRQELARSHYNRGILETTDAAASTAAEEDFAAAIGHLQKILADKHADADLAGCRQELARCYSNLAILRRSQGKLPAARQNYEQAIAIAEPLAAEFPEARKYQQELALYYNNLSNLLVALPDPATAAPAQSANARALAIYERLAAAVPEVRSELGNIHHSRGVILAKHGKADEARAEFVAAREVFEPLVAEFPEFPAYADRLGNAFYELAKLSYAAAKQAAGDKKSDAATTAYREALQLADRAAALHQGVVDRYPQDTASREHVRSDYFLEAWTLKQLHAIDEPSSRVAIAKTAAAIVKASATNAAHLKLAAELFAIAATLADEDPELEEMQRQELQQQHADQAIAALRAAIEHGRDKLPDLRTELEQAADPANPYHALHGRQDFSALTDSLSE